MSQVVPPQGLVGPSNFKVRRRTIARYGWSPDHPDHRDKPYVPKATPTPNSVDLDLKNLPVYDQGELGSCTGNALAAAIQFDRLRQGLSKPAEVPSRLFIYFGERVIKGTVASDCGASLRDGIKVVASDGACFETGPDAWPYDIAAFAEPPPLPCFAAAKLNAAVNYYRLNQQIADMQACLAEGFPFVFGFTAFAALESAAVERTGVLPMPGPDDKTIGGHAVMAVGYDKARKVFKVRNSWGADWGLDGYFWMPEDYLDSPSYADDFWTIRVVRGAAAAATTATATQTTGQNA
jgi:C1A family cysteine protease